MGRRASVCLGLLAIAGSVGSCSSGDATAHTYTDTSGRVYYHADCPGIDPLIRGIPDGLPNVESTTLEAVEAYVEMDPLYRVIPRNGWVWERLADGSVEVHQAEDYMLERTIESVDDCLPGYVFPGGIPVAYVINDG